MTETIFGKNLFEMHFDSLCQSSPTWNNWGGGVVYSLQQATTRGWLQCFGFLLASSHICQLLNHLLSGKKIHPYLTYTNKTLKAFHTRILCGLKSNMITVCWRWAVILNVFIRWQQWRRWLRWRQWGQLTVDQLPLQNRQQSLHHSKTPHLWWLSESICVQTYLLLLFFTHFFSLNHGSILGSVVQQQVRRTGPGKISNRFWLWSGLYPGNLMIPTVSFCIFKTLPYLCIFN